MGGMGYVGYFIPILFGLVILEYVISRIKRMETYRLSDTIVNISCGLMERLFDFFFIVVLYFLFDYIAEHIALWHLPNTPIIWILGLFVGDFLAYWHHRLSHEINFLWAAHIVHHQSEELNMSTVFRVSAFAVINRAFFWIWMPIVGFSPEFAASVIVFVGFYQFLTHTRLVGKVGILEHFFVTPSSHRVHHGRNDKYIDTNYGHVFIIWDKMFGTFQPEEEEPDYGIVMGFKSANPYWAYFYYWVDMFKRARTYDKLSDKIKLFFKKPDWTPKDKPLPPVMAEYDERGRRKKYILELPSKLTVYLIIQTVIVMATFMYLLINKETLDTISIYLIVGFILMSVLAFGMLMERKRFRILIEAVRLLGFLLMVTYLFYL